MADKYPSTMLVDLKGKTDPQAQSDEINKAFHDLLDKINKISSAIDLLSKVYDPLSQSAAGEGQFLIQSPSIGMAWVLPADGTWAYWGMQNSGVAINGFSAGIAVGGTTVGAAVGGWNWNGWAKRIT